MGLAVAPPQGGLTSPFQLRPSPHKPHSPYKFHQLAECIIRPDNQSSRRSAAEALSAVQDQLCSSQRKRGPCGRFPVHTCFLCIHFQRGEAQVELEPVNAPDCRTPLLSFPHLPAFRYLFILLSRRPCYEGISLTGDTSPKAKSMLVRFLQRCRYGLVSQGTLPLKQQAQHETQSLHFLPRRSEATSLLSGAWQTSGRLSEAVRQKDADIFQHTCR